jgi:hypothetical protein
MLGLPFVFSRRITRDLFPAGYFLTISNNLPQMQCFHHFQWLSNEMSSPKILLCPTDTKRKEAPNFATLSNSNISYFVGLLTNSTYPQDFLAGDGNILVNSKPIPAGLFTFPANAQISWSAEMHQAQGNIVLGDGSVQQFSTSRLREALTNQGVSTNLLLFP